jgi:hypothetical protein
MQKDDGGLGMPFFSLKKNLYDKPKIDEGMMRGVGKGMDYAPRQFNRRMFGAEHDRFPYRAMPDRNVEMDYPDIVKSEKVEDTPQGMADTIDMPDFGIKKDEDENMFDFDFARNKFT